MKYFGIKDLQTKSKELHLSLKRDKLVSLTHHGKPYALMVEVGEDDYLDYVSALAGLHAKIAMRRAQQRAVDAGLDKMSLSDINQEIQSVRRAKQ